MADDRITGKGSYILYTTGVDSNPDTGGDDVQPTFVPVVSYSPRFRKTYQNFTSSVNWDPDSKSLYSVETPNSLAVEIGVEGVFRIATIPITVITDMFDGEDNPIQADFWLNQQNRLCYGGFTVHDFKMEVMIHDVVRWSAVFRNFGMFKNGDFTVPGDGSF